MPDLLKELLAYTKACQRKEWGPENPANEYVSEMSEQIKGAIVAILEKRFAKGFAPGDGIREMYYKLLNYGERINAKDKTN